MLSSMVGIHDDQNDVQQGDDTDTPDAHLDRKMSNKRKSKGDDRSVKDSVPNKER